MQESLLLLGGNDKKKYIDIVLREIGKKGNYDETVKKLTSYFLKTNCERSQRLGMEFLFINGQYRELQKLIIKLKNCDKFEYKDWAKLYQIMFDGIDKKSSALQLFNQIHAFKPRDPILEILLEFSKVIVNFKIRDYRFIGSSLDKITSLMVHCENEFMIKSFRRRTAQVMFYYYWSRNEVIIARKIAYELLNSPIDARTKVRLHSGLGLTYLFDTYPQGYYHLKKALDLSEKHGIKDLSRRLKNHTIPFYSCHFKKTEGIKSESICEQAHLALVKGNKQEAIKLLNQIKDKTPFQYYYLGLAKEDKSILKKSYDMFILESNDYFFCRLPFNAMQKYSQ